MTTLAFALLAGGGVFAATAVARTAGGIPANAHTLCADERADSSRFEVVLGSTKTRPGARELQSRARRAGFSTRVERDNCTKYEIAVGRMRTRAGAGQLLERVRRAGFRGATIEADPSVSAATTSATTTPATVPVTTTTTASGTGTTRGGGGGSAQATTTTTTTPACTVKRKPDDHVQFEVVFGRTQSLAEAQTLLARTHDAGFAAGIEVDSCTEYEIAIAGFHMRAAAADLVAQAKSAGFNAAQIENS